MRHAGSKSNIHVKEPLCQNATSRPLHTWRSKSASTGVLQEPHFLKQGSRTGRHGKRFQLDRGPSSWIPFKKGYFARNGPNSSFGRSDMARTACV